MGLLTGINKSRNHLVPAFEMLTIYLGGRSIAKSKQINNRIIYKTEFLVMEMLGSHIRICIICNSQKTEAAQMARDRKMAEQTVVSRKMEQRPTSKR